MTVLLIPTLLNAALVTTPLAEHKKTVEVIALEYPPFTTLTISSGGIAFELLKAATVESNFIWKPYFLPPKRANLTLRSGDWCASFYPAQMTKSYIQYQLSDKSVSVGLVRLKSDSPFNWHTLSEFSGRSVAILSTDANSPFARQFVEAGMIKAQVQTIQAGIQMVLRGRVDFAMIDDLSFNRLETQNKAKLDMSTTSLLTTKVNIYVNPDCDIHLPNLKVLDSK